MSNRASSKQHGMHRIARRRPTARFRKKLNKANNRVRQIERQAALAAAIQKAMEAMAPKAAKKTPVSK